MMFIIGFGSYALSGPCEWTWKKFHRQPAGEPGIETKGPESGPGKTGE
jgi:hypothetical protein